MSELSRLAVGRGSVLPTARWQDTKLIFCTRTGTPVTAHNVRRDFRKVVEEAGLTGREWSPRELRHSFVSVLSDSGVPIEDISRLVGHSNTVVTETVYRHQIRPVIMQRAAAMDKIFGKPPETPPRAASAS
ncbi:tyrosine-type recombinase/integrase [Nonomuraea dietziae]|uniref:tyrosine-type recombinase/integrase n=1 Tax=Nonomuraea dietziae TaxID=65515 RepID=UPI0033F9BE16